MLLSGKNSILSKYKFVNKINTQEDKNWFFPLCNRPTQPNGLSFQNEMTLVQENNPQFALYESTVEGPIFQAEHSSS